MIEGDRKRWRMENIGAAGDWVAWAGAVALRARLSPTRKPEAGARDRWVVSTEPLTSQWPSQCVTLGESCAQPPCVSPNSRLFCSSPS